MQKKILVTGLSGFVGSRLKTLSKDMYEFHSMDLSTGIDIRNKQDVFDCIKSSNASVVLHLAAKTAVDACETEKDLSTQSEAWQINVEGTRHILDVCEDMGKRLIYVSTDMVFSGDISQVSAYTETDTPNPQNWYAQTKYEAEVLVQQSSIPWTIIRLAYPYQAFSEKKEYVRIFLSLLQQGKPISVVSDQYFTPFFVDDFADVIHSILDKSITGVVHAGGASIESPYEIAQKVADTFGLSQSLITPTTREQYFAGKAHRGFNTSLKNTILASYNVHTHSFPDGLEIMKNQLEGEK